MPHKKGLTAHYLHAIRGVAPLDPQPRWPEGYITVLREAGAQEKNIPHRVAWVRRFFARHQDRRRRDLGRTEIEAFLAETTPARKIYDGSFSVGWE